MTRRSDRRGTSLVCAALELIGGARLHSYAATDQRTNGTRRRVRSQ